MTDALHTDPGSCTAKQRKALAIAGRNRGMEIDEVRGLAGVASLHDLSSADASALIKRLSGDELPNPPGKAPRAYTRRRAGDRSARLIQRSHIDQIGRLMLEYFGNLHAARAWFKKTWHVDEPAALLTADRAGQVLAVLRGMLKRRNTIRTADTVVGGDA